MEFIEALRKACKTERNLVIPDIKLFSPKEGDLIGRRSPVELAKQLVISGAPALSVVTEEKNFHGSLGLLRQVCSEVSVPVLRKDFVTSCDDLVETKNSGAKAILLMYSCLGKEKLHELYYDAINLGLTPFVETHTKQELTWASELGAEFVGINNRDILQLERDDGTIAHTEEMLACAPKNSIIISESSLQNPDEVRAVVRGGASGALIGTALLRAKDIAAAYRAMTQKVGIKACGFTTEEDVAACSKEALDFMGFVVDYPVYVPWNITKEQAKQLMPKLRPGVNTVVVTGGDAKKVICLANELRPDCIQLHYNESFEQSQYIAKTLKENKIKVIKSIPTNEKNRKEMFGTCDLKEIVQMLNESDIYGVLFDSRSAENAKSGGECIGDAGSFQDELKAVIPIIKKRFFIAGGITEKNASDIAKQYQPDYIDVMTGVEDVPGKKSLPKLKALIDKIRR